MVDFAVQIKGERIMDGFENWMKRAEGNTAIDYGFHMIVGDVNESSLKEMRNIMNEGVTSFKLFMAYPGVLYSDDGEIFRAMQQASEDGTMIMMHAENGIAIDVLREQAVARGEMAPKYHSITRPALTESEAVHRAIALAETAGAPLYIVHMSAKEGVMELAKARERGLNAFGETCPHYMHLSVEDDMDVPGFEGAKYACSTPIRFKSEGHQEYLWEALTNNVLQVVSTDHASFFFDDDPVMGRQKRLGEDNFTLIPNGIPGVEERLNVMYQSGVVEGRFSLNRWVEMCCTAPARMMGLYPQKGEVALGADADIDPPMVVSIGIPANGLSRQFIGADGLTVGAEERDPLDTVIAFAIGNLDGKDITGDGGMPIEPRLGRALRGSGTGGAVITGTNAAREQPKQRHKGGDSSHRTSPAPTGGTGQPGDMNSTKRRPRPSGGRGPSIRGAPRGVRRPLYASGAAL